MIIRMIIKIKKYLFTYVQYKIMIYKIHVINKYILLIYKNHIYNNIPLICLKNSLIQSRRELKKHLK